MRCSLAKFIPDGPTSPAEFESLRAAAHQRGAILVMPDDDLGEWLRAAIESWARNRWGARRGERR